MAEVTAIQHGHSILDWSTTSTKITRGILSSTDEARVARESVWLFCPLEI